ncbi:MAG: Asp23/Gls24 family envelope stress response protein [Sciscionella sp.]
MTEQIADAATETAPAPSAPDDPGLPAPERRGRLEVDQSVVRKVAEHTANLVPGTVKATRKVAGVGIGERGATVRVNGSGDQVELSLDVALKYPSAIRTIVADVRAQVCEQVSKTTGYRVQVVDVTVSALLPESFPRVL